MRFQPDGRIYLSDVLSAIAHHPGAKPHPDGAGGTMPVPVLIELADGAGNVIGFGPVVGWELVPGGNGRAGVLVLRAEVKRFDRPPVTEVVALDPAEAEILTVSDLRPVSPGFDGTYPDPSRRANFREKPPAGTEDPT